MKRPCLGCRQVFDIPTLRNGRCLPCRSTKERARNRRRSEEMGLYSSRAWKELRRRVVDAAVACHWCHATDTKLTADHILRVRVRPDLALEPSNIVASCASCQLRRQYQEGGGRSS